MVVSCATATALGACSSIDTQRSIEMATDAGRLRDDFPPEGDAHASRGPAHSIQVEASTSTCALPESGLLDLDGNGTPESRVSLGACASGAAGTCLRVASPVTAHTELHLSDLKDVCTGTMVGPRLLDIGDHGGGAAHEIMATFCANDGALGSPTVAGGDVVAGTVLGRAQAPVPQKNAFVGALRGPGGKLHPFIAPSYGDALPPDPTYGAGGTWGYVCLFGVEATTDPTRCGVGFASGAAIPAPAGESWFREVGGYAQDLDADGWEDLSLIFHQRVLAISGRTGTSLGSLLYDVAAATEPQSPAWFHSGRNYGTHSAATAPSGAHRTIEIGAAPVGTFTDYYCNVSRFAAVIESPAGAPDARRLAWSHYAGFASSIFSEYDARYAADPSQVLTRLGNFTDRCMHRYGDSRTTMDGTPVVLFNSFHGAPVDTCLKEQYALYIGDPNDANADARPWSTAKQQAWGVCQEKNLKSRGTWAMEVLREADGLPVTGSLQTYVWGWSTSLRPGGEPLYLVEVFTRDVAFDVSDVPPPMLEVRALVNGLWSPRGKFPRAGRPAIHQADGSGARGLGAYSYFAELDLADIDCDGLPEVKLEDGTWIGWSVTNAMFVIKTR